MYNRGQGRTGPGPVATDAMLHPLSLPSFLIPYSPAPPPLPPSSLQAAFLGVLDGLAGVLVVRGERVRVGRGFASWGKEREFACGGARGLAREGRLCDTPCAPLRRRIHACGVACDSGTPHACGRRTLKASAAHVWHAPDLATTRARLMLA
jgi:hypothetical protein